MTPIADIKELEKIMRKQLIKQSELDGEFVRNSLSTYGEMLDKLLFGDTVASISPCEQLMLFELISRDSESDKSMTETDDTVTIYCSYSVHVIIYGDAAKTTIQKLIARMRTEQVRDDLEEEGVYLESVTEAHSMNEFKNGALRHRSDTDILISCKMSVDQVSLDGNVEILQPISIEVVKPINYIK